MKEDAPKLATAAGRGWAEQKAERLRTVLPAVDWPDVWDDADNGPRPFDWGETTVEQRSALELVASHAARDRWRELLAEQLALEAAEEGEHDAEAEAVVLEETLRGDLPQGISVGRDGPRVYVTDRATSMERTVTSLDQAWRVVAEWQEKRTPGI